jgi:hypothetical protein
VPRAGARGTRPHRGLRPCLGMPKVSSASTARPKAERLALLLTGVGLAILRRKRLARWMRTGIAARPRRRDLAPAAVPVPLREAVGVAAERHVCNEGV